MLLVNATAGPSRLHCYGLIAREFINQGTVTWEFCEGFDVRIPLEKFEMLSPSAQERVRYYGWLGELPAVEGGGACWYLTADDDRFTNHSDTPNTASHGCVVIAIRDILPGEEITFDYRSLTMDSDFSAKLADQNALP